MLVCGCNKRFDGLPSNPDLVGFVPCVFPDSHLTQPMRVWKGGCPTSSRDRGMGGNPVRYIPALSPSLETHRRSFAQCHWWCQMNWSFGWALQLLQKPGQRGSLIPRETNADSCSKERKRRLQMCMCTFSTFSYTLGMELRNSWQGARRNPHYMRPGNKNKEEHLPSHWKKTQLHCLPKLCTENKIWPMDNSSTLGEHLCTDRGHFPPLNRCYFTWENCSKRLWSIRRMKKRYSPPFGTSILKRPTKSDSVSLTLCALPLPPSSQSTAVLCKPSTHS